MRKFGLQILTYVVLKTKYRSFRKSMLAMHNLLHSVCFTGQNTFYSYQPFSFKKYKLLVMVLEMSKELNRLLSHVYIQNIEIINNYTMAFIVKT